MSKEQNHKQALRRMAIFATLLTVAGHVFLGFEQSWAQVVAALVVAYATELALETIDARMGGRKPRYAGGGPARMLEFLLSPHLTGLSVALLLYASDRLAPMIFATVVAICSKWLLRVEVGGRSRHFFNPSNLGISLTLLVAPSVGIAPPYQFTENVTGLLDWAVPGAIVVIGAFLNAKLTRRVPLIAGWLGGFALQAAIRALVFGTPLAAAFMPMTGMAFMLYTLYMITDPATTPNDSAGQAAFGASLAAVYGLLQVLHVVFGLFFALTIVCGVRGGFLAVRAAVLARSRAAAAAGEVRG